MSRDKISLIVTFNLLTFWIFIVVALFTLAKVVETRTMITESFDRLGEIERELDELRSSTREDYNLLEKTLDSKYGKLKEQQDNIQVGRGQRLPKVIQARVTAYSPLDDRNGINSEGDSTVTATGTKVRRGVVAVDPDKIPYGSLIYIEGYGMAVAEDTGGALRNYNGVAIDLLVDTFDEAIKWGKKQMNVTIIREGY